MKKTKTEKKSEGKAGGYRFLAILFFLLAAGGLFLGLLSKVLGDKLNGLFSLNEIYKPGTFYNENEIFKGKLDSSLFALVYGVVLSFISWLKTPNLANFNLYMGTVEGATSKTQLIVSYALLVLVVLLALAVIVSLIALISSFVSKKGARKCVMASGILTFLSYGGLFLMAYALSCFNGDSGKYTMAMFDFPTMAITAVTLILLIFAAIARTKGLGFLNSLNLLFVLVAFAALTFPSTQTAAYITVGGFEVFTGKSYLFITIGMAATLGMIGLNLFFASARNSAKKGFLFDVVRYALQLISVVLLIIAAVVDKSEIKVFSEIFKTDLIYTIVLAVASLLPIIVSIILMAVAKKQAAAAKAKAKKEAEEEDDVPEIETNNDEGYIDELVNDEIHRYVYEKRPEQPAPQPAPQPAYRPMPISPDYMASDLEAPPEQPAPAEPVQPIFQPNIIVQAPPAPAQEEVKPREKTEFERRMEAIARSQDHPTAAPTPQPKEAPMAQPFTPVYTGVGGRRKSKMQQMQMMDEEPASPYMAGHYDQFLSKLTSQEVSEFGDLFISNKYGMQNFLPVYVIGGDNTEFFNKVFIYLGRFRNYISSDLLEKLNVYVSAIRTQK